MPVRRVFMDANVIIEAYRISAWPELSKGCWLETVQECEKEALTGSTVKFGYVSVDAKALRAGLHESHLVGKKERDKLTGKHPACLGMDPGEKDLFAYLFSNHRRCPRSSSSAAAATRASSCERRTSAG
jgi:hypothetical protein